MDQRSDANEMARPPKPQKTRPVRVTDDVYHGANVLASIEDTDLTAMISEILRPIIKEKVESHGLKFPISGEKPEGEGADQAAEPKPKKGKGKPPVSE